MVRDDGEAAELQKTLDITNPDGGVCVESPDAPDLPGVEDSQIPEDLKMGARVSGDGGDDMSVTLAELSSKRLGKKGAHHLKDADKEPSKHGDSGSNDEKIENASVSASVSGDDDSVLLRRSRRKKIDVDFGDNSKKIKDVEKEKDDGEQKPVDDDEDEDEDDEEEEESKFSVGDFVWGKVKSHPWWPGRVFDPSDASQQALKYKHEGRILVAYFGDATFAWCDETQLKPFVDNFAEMSKQSSSKNFLNAVEEAATEFGRLVELDMTCYCTPRSHQTAGAQHQVSEASNAGIKGGVNVNKGGIGMYSVDKFSPAAFLDDLRVVGKHASVDNLLELTTLRSCVSAVYRPKDGSLLLKLSEVHENVEDEGVGEDTIRGPVEEPVQLLTGMPDALMQVKRKERSVAEILYGDDDGGDVVVEGEKSVKADLKYVRKKRKVVEESVHEDESMVVHQSGKRKKKLETKTKTGSRSSRMKVKETPKPIVEATNLTAFEETEMTPRTRERKKSKYLSPPYTNLEYYRQTAVNSPRGQAVTKAVETPKEDDAENGKPNGSVPETPRRASTRKNSIASSNNVLSGIKSAALSGQLSKKDAVKGFLSSYRSSKYQNESGSEANDESESVVNDEEENLKKKTNKLKNKAKEVNSETESAAAQSAALHLKFPAGYMLPSIDDLGGLYAKFGALDTSKTKVTEKSSSAKVVFLRASDAEAACESSKESSPFGEAEVSYRIRYINAVEADENGYMRKDSETKKRKRSTKKQSTSDGGLKILKQKLEGMATMVDEAGDGKVSSELKLSLESRLKDLLEEVKAL